MGIIFDRLPTTVSREKIQSLVFRVDRENSFGRIRFRVRAAPRDVGHGGRRRIPENEDCTSDQERSDFAEMDRRRFWGHVGTPRHRTADRMFDLGESSFGTESTVPEKAVRMG